MQNLPFFVGEWEIQHNRPLLPLLRAKRLQYCSTTAVLLQHCSRLFFFCWFVCSFFQTFLALKTWFEFSRVKLCKHYLKGNKNYFDLVGSSSSRGFELPRVKLR